jgi:site-specific DNA recombinase
VKRTVFISWHPDRLARNSVDGGQIIYLLDTGKLASLKFPTTGVKTLHREIYAVYGFRTKQILCGFSFRKYEAWTSPKSENGNIPSQAPVGYLNDSRTKTIVVDKKNLKLCAWLLNDMQKAIKG